MGDPRFPRKHYDTPSHPWQKERIEKENALVHQYGLKNKREIWKASTNVRQMRQQARKLTAAASEQAQKERRLLLGRLDRLGLLDRGSNLEDVLRMDVEKLLDRRLQTQVYLQGLASTAKQSRQLITHGHITIEGTVARVPGMLVTRMQEKQIAYFSGSPLMSDLHPVRPKPRTDADFDTETAEEEAPAAPAKEEKAGTPAEKKAKSSPKAEKPAEAPAEKKAKSSPKAEKPAEAPAAVAKKAPEKVKTGDTSEVKA
jgi:small subunit ribosomal protein S4